MKKIILGFLVLTNLLFGANKDEVLSYLNQYFSKLQDVSVSIDDEKVVSELEDTKAYYFAITSAKENKVFRDVIFNSGNFIFSEKIEMNTSTSLKKKYKKYFIDKSILPLIKQEEEGKTVFLKGQNATQTMVILTDPECPFCRKELSLIEERLKTNNVKLVFTPVHGKSAFQKVVLIQEGIKDTMSNDEKIKVLRKYFDEKYVLDPTSVPDKKTALAIERRDVYLKAGVEGVPYILTE